MSAVRTAARGAVTRRRVQTVVTGVVALLATATSVLSIGLLVASLGPFDRAFASLRGAHATVSVDATKATAAQIQAAGPGITAVGGPYPTTALSPKLSNRTTPGLPMTVVGRAEPGGPVDTVKISTGRWVGGPGEVVLSGDGHAPRLSVGERLTFGDTELTVVGIASSISATAAAWVTPEQLTALRDPAEAPTFQALYRFADAGDNAAVAAGVAAVRAALPDGAVLGSTSYLQARQEAAGTAELVVPFVTAFAVLGVVMSVLIVGNVVSGAVVAGYRGIGVFKTLGFTPAQVSAVYLGQVLVPALVGAALGTAAGHLLAAPLLRDTARSFAVPEVAAIPWWVDVVTPLGLAAVVAVAALIPAVRAGRVPAVQAIAVGRAPRTGRGFRAHRALARVPLPRAVGLGLATPFARPARTAMTVVALVLGTAAVTFAYGLSRTLTHADDGLSRMSASQVTVDLRIPRDAAAGSGPVEFGGPPTADAPSADPVAVAKALRADQGTERFTAVSRLEVRVPGRTEATEVIGYDADSAWLGYPVVGGRWFEKPGEAVVPTSFLRASALRVGDEIALESEGRRTTVRIVGEMFSNQEDEVLVHRDTLAELRPGLPVTGFEVRVVSGTDVDAYAERVSGDPAFAAGFGGAMSRSDENATIAVLLALIATLTLLVAVVAGLGVLNTVALDTRERAQAIGVLKSLGMTPRQTMAMVVTSVLALGLLGGAAGIPLGVALHRLIAPAMATTADLRLPDSMLEVYGAPAYAVLLASGAVLAALGALLPASWAARTRAAVWRTE